MKQLILFLLLAWLSLYANAQLSKQIFEFTFEGVTLNGVLNLPANTPPKGLVLIVHGAGQTHAVAQEWHYDIRATLVNAGYATYMWDKMGCGKSGGNFNYNQPVQNSAEEVIAAINALKAKQIPGAESIGLWGISRAGWINPLVINQYPDIKFWISVSGVDDKENFRYLLQQNLRIDGLPQDSIDLIVDEWSAGVRISHAGGSYEEYQAATRNLNHNAFMKRFMGGEGSEAGYYTYQKQFMKEKLDPETGLPLYIADFDSLLSSIQCPVLALFGEKDMNVDWQLTKALYERTLGKHTDLTIRSFPEANHNLFQCKTGGFYEFQDHKLPWNRPEGFLESMSTWLEEKF